MMDCARGTIRFSDSARQSVCDAAETDSSVTTPIDGSEMRGCCARRRVARASPVRCAGKRGLFMLVRARAMDARAMRD